MVLLATATVVLWLADYPAHAAVAAVLWLAGYPLSCWLWPFRRCYPCRGRGRHFREDGRVFRPCWWCKGTGRRLRFGRRGWNWWRR